jgi:hypothetical protein
LELSVKVTLPLVPAIVKPCPLVFEPSPVVLIVVVLFETDVLSIST